MIPNIQSAHDSSTRNIINAAIDSINAQGKSIQDLVAKGQLTPAQYASLIQAVNGLISKGDVSVHDINKNLGKLDGTFFTSEFIKELNDGIINTTDLLPHSVTREHLTNKSVSGTKTTFLQPGSKNLFNKNAVVYGQRFDENGDIFTITDWSYSELMQVKRNQDYIITGLHGANPRLNYYDGNNNVLKTETFQATSGVPIKITTTDNTYFIALSPRSSQVPDIQITEGNEALPYHEYYDELYDVKIHGEHILPVSIVGDKIAHNTISEINTTFIETSSNLFEPNKMTENGTITHDGQFDDHIYYKISELIELTGETYSFKGVIQIAEYDINNQHIRTLELRNYLSDYLYEKPSDVHQIRYVIPLNDRVVDVLYPPQINLGSELLPYEEPFKRLNKDIEVEGATGITEKTVYISVPNEGISYFGIDGNGVTDDTKGLRDYLYSLKENGGGKMQLPSGNYKISGTLEVPSNTIIEGQGTSTIFELADDYDLNERLFRGDAMSMPYIVTEEGSENIGFKDFRVTGNKQDFRDELHHAVAFMDTVNGHASNVFTDYINYDAATAKNAYLMAFNVAFIRAKNVKMYGGRHEFGGYENVGFEYAEDIVVDSIYSGDAWRTSYQVHQGSKNIKTINSTIRQADTVAHAALTIHSRVPTDDLVFQNNSIYLDAPGGSHPYMGSIQFFGPNKKASFLGNTIIGKKNGIYNLNPAELLIVKDNIIDVENGVGIRVDGPSIVSGNFVNVDNGAAFEKAEGSNVVGSGNIGFTV